MIEGVKRNKFPEHLFLLTPSIVIGYRVLKEINAPGIYFF
jgi:hypothetical protein